MTKPPDRRVALNVRHGFRFQPPAELGRVSGQTLLAPGRDHEIGRAPARQNAIYVRHVVACDPGSCFGPGLSVPVPAPHQATVEFVAGGIDIDREIEQRPEPAPRLLVKQKIIALDQHELYVLADDGGARPRQLDRPVKDRNGDFRLIGAYALEQRLEAMKIEGFGAPFRARRPRASSTTSSKWNPSIGTTTALPSGSRPLRIFGERRLAGAGGPASATTKRLCLPARLKIVAASEAISDMPTSCRAGLPNKSAVN